MKEFIDEIQKLKQEIKEREEDIERLYIIAHGLHIRRSFEKTHSIVVDLLGRLQKIKEKYNII